MRKIKGAVVGLGYWGPNLVRNFIKIPRVEIKKVCDTSQEVLAKFNQEYPHIPATTDFNIILDDNEINFVSIATPLKTHYLLAKNALLAGKNVLIEKPMVESIKQAEELLSISEKKNVILMVGHTFVYSEAVKEVKKIIGNKAFGKILYYESERVNLGKFSADTNVIWDLAPHDLSILHFLLNETPTKVKVIGSSHISKKTIEIAHIFLYYKKNIVAHVYVSWLSPVKVRSIVVGGDRKMVVYNDIEPSEKIRIYDKKVTLTSKGVTPFTPAYRSGDILIPKIAQVESLYNQLNHFINSIQKRTVSLTSGKDGAEVVRILEAIDKAIETGSDVYL